MEKSENMKLDRLSVAQMLQEHPIKNEQEGYRQRYLWVLDYVVRKYSTEDDWANAALTLYRSVLLDGKEPEHTERGLPKNLKVVTATKFRAFKFFSYRYCLLADCIFIAAFSDREKGKKIFAELEALYRKRYRKKLREVFEFLYGAENSLKGISQLEYFRDCWTKNRAFQQQVPIKVLITATMSAGKSTLLNALAGKKVNKTQNEACTAKIHSIFNKPYEDGFSYEWDGALNLNAGLEDLMDDSVDNQTEYISVGTFFRSCFPETRRVWLIDTPGVNSADNVEHKIITEKLIRETDPDMVICVLNGQAIGTDDERKHLLFLKEQCRCRILFVINKVDSYRKNEDSIRQTLETTRKELEKVGFQSPCVVPVSAYAAFLAKQAYWGEPMEEEEADDMERLAHKLKRDAFRLDVLYPKESAGPDLSADCSEAEQLMLHSGILNLENMIYHIKEQ